MPKSPASEIAGWPPALRLMTAALGGSLADADPALWPAFWDEAVDLAIGRHRVAPQLLTAAGEAMPDEPRARLTAEARRNAAEALRQKVETLRITAALEKAGCEPVVFKGWPLAEIAHGGAGNRHAKDIDLWVPRVRFGRALGAMQRLGYRGNPDSTLPVALLTRDGVEVELHWRSERFRGWPGLSSLPDAVSRHDCGEGRTIRVPSPQAAVVCLCLHGQQHVWLRLKWLLDIDRLARLRADRLMDDLAYATEAGAGGAVAMALRLSAAVFATPLPEGWPRAPLSARWVERRMLALIADPMAAPGSGRAKIAASAAAFLRSETPAQRAGVLRHLAARTWRRAA